MQRKWDQSSSPVCCKENENVGLESKECLNDERKKTPTDCESDALICRWLLWLELTCPLRAEGPIQPTGGLCDIISYYSL